MRAVLWKWVYNDRQEMEKTWFNGIGWSHRSRARKYTEAEAQRIREKLPGSMIRMVK